MANGLWGILAATGFVGGGVGLGLYGSRAWRHIQQFVTTRIRGEQPTRRPLEDVVVDLHRLRREMSEVPAGTPLARRRGLQLAYDDALIEVSECLAVPTTQTDDLTRHELGPQRDVARLMLEQRLIEAGLDFHPV